MVNATASGGFVYRAERQSLEPQTATSEAVGPGIYNPSLGAREVSAAPAPFHTSNERNLMENLGTSALTPGVGAYEAATALDSLLNRRIDPVGSTAPFASQMARMYSDRTKAENPGPGSYAEGNAWLKRSHHYSAPPARQRVSYQKVPSAPSIPSQHQSFGYEEGGNGELVLQRPQDPIHTGVGRDTVGPGSYDLAISSLGLQVTKAVAWGNSRTKRGIIPKNEVPGPGSYNLRVDNKPSSNAIVVSINGMDVQFGGASGTSQFASKVPLISQRTVSDYERTPGPGAYQVDAGAARVKELQNFGANSKRAFEVDPMKSHSAPSFYRNPGPGAYDDPRRSIVHHKSLAEPQPFHTTANRFSSNANGLPGPGEYKPDYIQNLANDLQSKAAVSRGGVFGSTASRFIAKDDTGAQRSPATYNPKLDVVKPDTKGDTATFVSKTERFRPSKAPSAAVDYQDQGGLMGAGPVKGDPTRLGPGCYTEQDTWVKKPRHPGYHKAAFGSEAQRSSAAAPASMQTPGPGRYNSTVDMNKVFKPFSAPAKETVFGTQTNRFKGAGTFTPGPGYYSTSGDVVKKSFNVTYAGVEVA